MKLVTTKFKMRGLHEKHVVAYNKLILHISSASVGMLIINNYVTKGHIPQYILSHKYGVIYE